MGIWIGCDFDSTLAHLEHGQYRPGVTGRPIMPMVERVKGWLRDGHPEFGTRDVRIFTARAASDGSPAMNAEVEANIRAIRDWCTEVFGRPLPVTASKDYGPVAIYDDIAHHVIANTGVVTS